MDGNLCGADVDLALTWANEALIWDLAKIVMPTREQAHTSEFQAIASVDAGPWTLMQFSWERSKPWADSRAAIRQPLSTSQKSRRDDACD